MRSCFSPLSNISGDKGLNGWTWIIGLRHGRCDYALLEYRNLILRKFQPCVSLCSAKAFHFRVIDFSVSVFNQIWTSVSMSDCRAELSFVNPWKMKNFMGRDGWDEFWTSGRWLWKTFVTRNQRFFTCCNR